MQKNSKLQSLFSFDRKNCEDAMNNVQSQSKVHNFDQDLYSPDTRDRFSQR